MEDTMARESFAARLAGAILTGGALLSLMPAALAATAGGAAPTPIGTEVEHVQYGSETCAELRRACLYKRELGERGQGNCSRYRSECATGSGTGTTSYSRYRYREYRAYRPWRHDD
jgi:hypothetical protein